MISSNKVERYVPLRGASRRAHGRGCGEGGVGGSAVHRMMAAKGSSRSNTSRVSDLIEPMDLANMRRNGLRPLEIVCQQFRHQTVMNVDHLPGDLTVKSIEPGMMCTKCGTIGADVRPNWKERGR
jgi:hypothetical protein